MEHTARTWIAALLLAAMISAQTGTEVPAAPAAALARAKLIETQEGDLKAAEQAYRALVDSDAAKAVQQEVALRLGSLLWRLERKDEGKPFLERAAAMGGEFATQATAVLQGQGEAGRQAEERLAKAKALVDRIDDLAYLQKDAQGNAVPATTATLDAAVRELEWLGEAAAQALVARLDQVTNKSSGAWLMADGRPEPNFSLFGRILWKVGTPPAREFLQRAAADPHVDWRRFVTAQALPDAVAKDLEPAVVQFLRDPDPTGEVQRNLRQHLMSLPLATLVQLIGEEHAGSRAGGLAGLAGVWNNLSAEERLATFASIEAPVRRALQDTAGGTSRAAWQLVSRFAMHGPRVARRFVLAEVARYPEGLGGLAWDFKQMAWPLDDAELALFVQTARTRGSNRDAGLHPHLETLWTMHQPEWTAQGIDALLELLERGYGGYQGTDPEWLPRFFELARPEQLVRFVRALPQLRRHGNALQELVAMYLPPGVFEAARDVIEAGVRAEPKDRQFFRANQGSRQPGSDLSAMLRVVGRTQSPAAADWLAAFAERVPVASNDVAIALVMLSSTGDAPAVRSALRQLLVTEGLAPQLRSMVFAELARLGDEPSIELYPRAYALGLEDFQPNKTGLELRSNRPSKGVPQPGPVQLQSFTAKGIGFLGLVGDGSGGAPRPWHGYAVGPLDTAWRTLLASPAGDEVWEDLCSSPWGRTNLIPEPLLPLIAQQLQARWATSSREQRNQMGSTVLHVFGWAPTDPQFFSGTWVSAVRSLLGADDDGLPQTVFVHLPYDVARQFAAEGRAILRRAPSLGFFGSLRRVGVELSTDDWLWLLQTTETGLRKAALQQLPGPLDAALQKAVEQNLADPNAEVRAAACEALARLVATDSVPALLLALRDSTEAVRKAAADALERLRFHQEQQAFWQDAKAGIDTSPQNAASKLLRQAQPQEPKDQRLLALRSLGVLAAPETLPYLIDWTKDPDPAVAAAAREALLAIHGKAAPKK